MAAKDTGTWTATGHESDEFIQEYEVYTTRTLGEDDLGYVLRVLHNVGLVAKWKEIGQTLQVNDGSLQAIGGDSSDCLLQVVALWLNGQTRLPDKHAPSWWRVVWVVADPQGGGIFRPAKVDIAKKCKDEGTLSKFIPKEGSCAADTPPTQILDEYDGSQYLFKTSSEALDAICKDLVSVKHLWKPIGVLLGVKYTAFLQQRKDGKDQENLRQTIKQWLDTSKMLTLQRLVEAVEHSAGGNNYSLARQIKDKHTATAASVKAPPSAHPLPPSQTVPPSQPLLPPKSSHSGPRRGDDATKTLLEDFPGKKRHFAIADQIGTHYDAFGTALLADDMGTIVPQIVSNKNGKCLAINQAILTEWINGRGMTDKTWGGLVDVLRKPALRLNTLADDIEKVVGKP